MNINTSNLKDTFSTVGGNIRRHTVLLFIFFLLSIYSFLAWQVVSLDKVEPDPAVVSAKVKTAGVPHIDQDVLTKIQLLQDNSVEVQSLFDKARSNPFQE